MLSPVITLTTDFGLRDPFVGMMKGVILSRCREARIVDITHEVAPQSVLEAAFILGESFAYFPHGTIHVGVVDPGVGSARKPMVMCTENYLFVGPDNGIFTRVEETEPVREVVEIAKQDAMLPKVSATFHGRDVFGPAAAYLALGNKPSALGPTLAEWTRLDYPKPRIGQDSITGQIIWVDRFGNLISNVSRTQIEEWSGSDRFAIQLGSTVLHQVSASYASVPSGQTVAVFGSGGFLELATNRGNAAIALNAGQGDMVFVTRVAGS